MKDEIHLSTKMNKITKGKLEAANPPTLLLIATGQRSS
jgi:hypothetical protein